MALFGLTETEGSQTEQESKSMREQGWDKGSPQGTERRKEAERENHSWNAKGKQDNMMQPRFPLMYYK